MLTTLKQIPEIGEHVEQITTGLEGEQEDEEEDDDDNVIITTERPEQEIEEQERYPSNKSHDKAGDDQEVQQTYRNGNGNDNFGFDQNQQGFGGMDFSNINNFNPMMMQNGMGMPNFAMGMQNMMGEYRRVLNNFKRNTLRRVQGMPGMNMDPSMMFNGGFGGMGGMNDMSMMGMGMGMGNMSGFGGMPGMGMSGGPGFFPGNGGYNQQSFGNNMHQNFHHNRGYGGRPYGRGFRGRGWGGYNRGRGNWQNHGHFQGTQNYMNQQNYQQQQGFQGDDDSTSIGQQQPNRRGSPTYEPMNGAVGDTANKDSVQADLNESGTSIQADVDVTDQTGVIGIDAKPNDIEGAHAKSQNDGVAEGKHHFNKRSSARADTCLLASEVENAKNSIEEDANDVLIHDVDEGPATTSANTEGGAEHGGFMGEMQGDNGTMQSTSHCQVHDPQYQHGFGYGGRGRGSLRGGRVGFRGRGGAYGYVSAPGDTQPAAAPPVNAPTGPKAFREGKPNSGFYSRPQPAPAAPAVSPTTAAPREQLPPRDEHDRPRSRSRSKSDRGHTQERDRSVDPFHETDEARHEKRRRRKDEHGLERNGVTNGEKSSRKERPRSETPDEYKSRRRRKDEERHHSRSHRDRSRDKHRRRHRSRSPERDSSDKEGDIDSRRKSKSDRRRESRHEESEYARDKDRSRKSSRREDDYERSQKDRSNNSSKHGHSGRDDREQERERERDRRPVLEEPQDDIGFKIKGSKSAAMQAELDSKSMAPPKTFARDRDSRRQSASGTPNTSAGDPYAEERERRQRERLDRENSLRRQSSQSLGKRGSRDEDEFEAPAGPKSDTGRAKKVRRKVAYKYEDEIGDGYEEQDNRRWR